MVIDMKKFIILFLMLILTGCSALIDPNYTPPDAAGDDSADNNPAADNTDEPANPLIPLIAGAAGAAVANEILPDSTNPLVPIVAGIATAAAAESLLSSDDCTNESCKKLKDEHIKNDPVFAPIEPVEPAVNVISTGSLFQDSYANNLYSDIKAHRVGDIITVYLEESTSASKQAGTTFGKNNNYSIEISDIILPNVTESGVTVYGGGGEGNQTSSFSGDSGADQSNSLQGSITVNVTRVLSNGNLEIRGEKWLMLNNGEEFIRIKGMIRSEDVGSDNSISSTHIANSRIQYGGTGDFANTQKQGWLTSFFSKNWPL